jgi:lipopolysaccharide export LptBFGC system permease protein LptF
MDLIVNRGVPVAVVAEIFLLSLGFVLAMSVPCAVLVAVLMTFGRLSQDNEITALRAGGVNLAHAVAAPLAASLGLAVLLTLFNNHVLPDANHAFLNLMVDIGRMRPTVKLQEGVFITDFPGYNLLVQSVNGRTNEMRGVTIYQLRAGGPATTIFASRGRMYYTPDGRTAVLELKDGEIHDIPSDEPGARRYRRLIFKTHVINIPEAGAFLERTVRESRTDREMSAHDLIGVRDSIRTQYRRSAIEHRMRLQALGVPPGTLQALTPERRPWGERLAAWVRRALTRIPEVESPTGAVEARARGAAQAHRRSVGRDPQEVLAPGRLRGVRAARRAARDAGPAHRTGGGVPLGAVLPLLLPVPGRGRGAGHPPADASVAGDVAAQSGAGRLGVGGDLAGVRAAVEGRATARGPGVRILDRYLLREFSAYLVLGCAGFLAILLVVEMFQRIDLFLDQHTTPVVIARYLLFQSPEKLVQILPVGMLLATFLALGQLNKFGERAAQR